MKALVLSGGGVKGAYQLGVLQYLFEKENPAYDILCGVSVGAINAAFLSQFSKEDNEKAIDRLAKLWSEVDNKKIWKKSIFGKLVSLWRSSVYDSKPLQQWISSTLDVEKVRSSGKMLRVVAVSWDTGRVYVATEGDAFLQRWVMASSSFPIMLSPIEINGENWTDGGVRQVTPLGEAIRAGATDIDVIMCDNPKIIRPFDSKGRSAMPTLTIRALEIMVNQIEDNDLKLCGLKNSLATLSDMYKEVKIRVFMPEVDLVEDSLDFSPTTIQRLKLYGYEQALRMVR